MHPKDTRVLMGALACRLAAQIPVDNENLLAWDALPSQMQEQDDTQGVERAEQSGHQGFSQTSPNI